MNKYCILILTSYEYESLQLTFKALDHTVTETDVPIIIVLNGNAGSFRGSKVEQLCRQWAANGVNRHVIRPISSGKEPLFAIQEVVSSVLLKDIEYILKIDDDLIPLKKGWASELSDLYHESEKKYGKIGFTTGLINNNSWGFRELVSLYDKWDEYKKFMDYPSVAGKKDEVAVVAGNIDVGVNGTIWQYPALAAWLHSWTSFDIPVFVDKTTGLGIKEINIETHYSIGCMYSHKNMWSSLIPGNDNFDELLIHEYCKKHKLRKFAAMYQPFLHLYYFRQRLANAYLFPEFMRHLADFFQDADFKNIHQLTIEDRLIELEEKLAVLKILETKFGKIESIFKKFRKFLPF